MPRESSYLNSRLDRVDGIRGYPVSDAADAAGDDSGQGADLVFRSGAAADRRADEGVARPLVAAEKEKVADDLPNQGSFQSLSSEREGESERDTGG